ncbi:MAG: hypothetical protein E7620_07135 [Ruminococcaceae bacterium]|nr:hypothetical protein [Oscillospiraceae bacterium]
MKRSIAAVLSLFMILLVVCSCGSSKQIKCIKVDGVEYRPVYLYSFKDAKIDGEYSILSIGEEPTESGYVYSTEKLEKGDTVRVWENLYFKGSDNSYTTGNAGTTAIVDKVLKTNYVKAESKNDTYILTYYNLSSRTSNKTATNRSDLEEQLEEIKAEVTKERVTIFYRTDK